MPPTLAQQLKLGKAVGGQLDFPAVTLAKLDALSKGIGRGDAWDALTDAALTLCGRPAVVPV